MRYASSDIGRVLSRNFCLGGGGSSGEGTARGARLVGGSGGSPPENFEFQIARDAI